MREEKLPFFRAVGYGIADLSFALTFTTNVLFLFFFLTEVKGYNPAIVGTALFLTKLVEAFIDPFIGSFSDKISTRWGRKRPFLLFSALPLAVTFAFLYSLPAPGSPLSQFAVLFIAAQLFYFSYAMGNIPYASMTAVLTSSPQERTRLTSFRFTFSGIATLLAAGATLSLVQALSPQGASGNPKLLEKGFQTVAVIYGMFILFPPIVTFLSTEEREKSQNNSYSLLRLSTWKEVRNNRPFLNLVFTYFIQSVAIGLLGSGLIYFFQYNLKLSEGESSNILGLSMATALLFIFPIYLLSKKLGKKQTYIFGTIFAALVLLPLALFTPLTPKAWVYTSAVSIGIAMSFYNIMPNSLLPDTVEYDRWVNGLEQKREGLYFGLWSFFEKLAQSCSYLLMGLILSVSPFLLEGTSKIIKSGQGTIQTKVNLLVSVIPLLLFTVSLLTLWPYSLSEEKYKRMMNGK